MTSRQRQGFGAIAALLALLALVWMRTDIGAMRSAAESSIADRLGARITIGSQHIGLFPVFGVHLKHVSILQRDWEVSADEVMIHVGLFPLLFGKTELQQAEFVSPHIRINNVNSSEFSVAKLLSLPFGRMRILHGSLQLGDNPPLIRDFDLDLRDIGRNRDTLWESQAMLDGHLLRSYGRLSMRSGAVHAGFGKLKLEQIPAIRLASLLPEAIARRMKTGMSLSGSGTWELRPDRSWALFGDLHLADEGNELGQARGKLERTADGDLVWKDSFLHVGDKAVVAVSGDCKQGICESRLKAGNMPLDFLLPFWAGHVREPEQWKGNLGFDVAAHWQGDRWQLQGGARLGSSRMQFGDDGLALPALKLAFDKLSGQGVNWELDDGRVTVGTGSESLAINAALSKGGDIDATLSTAALTDQWVPMGNILLASLGEAPKLGGEGKLAGRLHVRIAGQKIDLDGKSDVAGLHLTYAELLDKPAGVGASADVHLGFDDRKLRRIDVRDAKLAGATVGKMSWTREGDRVRWQLKAADIDLDAIAKAGVRLPESIPWHGGRLAGEGSGTLVRTADGSMLPGSFTGALEMQSFGLFDWRWSGRLSGAGERASAAQLHVEGAEGVADIAGTWHFPATIRADVRQANLDWEALPALPEMWSGLSIAGKFSQLQLRLLRNPWKQMQGRYRWQQGRLHIEGLKGRLDNGDVISKSLDLMPSKGTLGVRGDLRLQNLHLGDLRGVQAFTASEMRGRLYANLKLDGALPVTGLSGWRADGDIVVYDGYRLPKFETSGTTPAGSLPAWAQLYAFRRLDAHIDWKLERIKVTAMQLKQMGDLYKGEAGIAADGSISGRVTDSAGGIYSLSGSWPKLVWTLENPRR